MRLINVETFEIEEHFDPPSYAILSHTWGQDEVTFQHMQDLPAAREMAGFRKIALCCEQARRDGWKYAWVDTCCIDKTSSAELSEAINSMYQWYGTAMVCYAYLTDINSTDELFNQNRTVQPRWFTRGWTLQELVAPLKVVFYSENWTEIGTKASLHSFLSRITGIPSSILKHEEIVTQVPVANRMRWASRRVTQRPEDMAYCLLGIFDINMPLLYGEGKKAFRRLQEEVLRRTEDHTIFLSNLTVEKFRSRESPGCMLADSPEAFRTAETAIPMEAGLLSVAEPPRIVNDILHITLPVKQTVLKRTDINREFLQRQNVHSSVLIIGAFNCVHPEQDKQIVRYFLCHSTNTLDQSVLRLYPLPPKSGVSFSPWVPTHDIRGWARKKCIITSTPPIERITTFPRWQGEYENWQWKGTFPDGMDHEMRVETEILFTYRLCNEVDATLLVAWGVRPEGTFVLLKALRVIDDVEAKKEHQNFHNQTMERILRREIPWINTQGRSGLLTEKMERYNLVDARIEVAVMIIRGKGYGPQIQFRTIDRFGRAATIVGS